MPTKQKNSRSPKKTRRYTKAAPSNPYASNGQVKAQVRAQIDQILLPTIEKLKRIVLVFLIIWAVTLFLLFIFWWLISHPTTFSQPTDYSSGRSTQIPIPNRQFYRPSTDNSCAK